jgi:hypothetical protein
LSVRARPRRCCADVTPDYSFGAGQDIIEVLTKCLVQHLSGGDVCFEAAWGDQAAAVRESPIRGPPGQTRRQHRKRDPIGGFPHVCCTVNNHSPNNGSGCFSPRAHRPSGRASFKASTHRHVLKTAAPRLKSPGVEFIAKVSEGRACGC